MLRVGGGADMAPWAWRPWSTLHHLAKRIPRHRIIFQARGRASRRGSLAPGWAMRHAAKLAAKDLVWSSDFTAFFMTFASREAT